MWRLALVVLLSLKACVIAEPNEDLILGVADSKRVGKSDPISADNAEWFSLPYSQILRDTEPPYESLFRDVRAGGRFTEKVGPADSLTRIRMFNGPHMNVPWASHGMRPENAEFKLGRFYLDLHSLSASLLYSDNVDLTEQNRDDGVIGIVRLTSALVYQVTEGLRFATRGALVYFPFRGKIGVEGFGIGIEDPRIGFETRPLFQTQLTLDQRLGRWDVEVIDEVSVHQRSFGASRGLDLIDGEQFEFDEEDRAGRYVFRPPSYAPPGGGNASNRDNGMDYNYISGRNLVGASAGRLLPTVTRFEFGGYHSDYWYDGTSDSRLPRSRDTVYAVLKSQRETLRFKPFLRYHASHYDYDQGWSEEARAGFHGPVTENLDLLANAGYYWRTDSDHTTYLARLRLRHTFNPLTYHQFQYYRGTTEPIEEITDVVSYRLRHVFRDNLSGQFYGSLAKFEDPRTGARTGEERRAAIRFNYNLAQRTTLRLSGAYADFRNEDEEDPDFEEWIGRGEIFYRHTTSLQTQLIYQYRDRHSDMPGRSYWENLVTLTVIKYF